MHVSSNKAWVYCMLMAAMQTEPRGCCAFTNRGTVRIRASFDHPTTLQAAPKRLKENVEGVIYVNEKCINCAACSAFAPSVFQRADRVDAHIVYHQPETKEEISDARAAMAACPVAAIRSETLAQRRHLVTASLSSSAYVNSNMEKQTEQYSWTDQDEELARHMALNPKLNGLELPFPRPLLYHAASAALTKDNIVIDQQQPHDRIRNVYNVGHHNEASFGATPYLLKAMVQGKLVWIMVDTPRFGKSAMDAVTKITGPAGPDYLLLTHVDDTADHDKWAAQYPLLRRLFHAGDTGRHNWRRDHALNDVEIMLPVPDPTSRSPPRIIEDDDDKVAAPFLHAYSMDGSPLPSDWYDSFIKDPQTDVVILHTPGHSPGSITLWKKPHEDQPGIIFTGDHYAFTTRTGRMSGFPRYGNDLQLQATSLRGLLNFEWDIVAPGHGHPRDYSQQPNKDDLKQMEMEEALVDLLK